MFRIARILLLVTWMMTLCFYPLPPSTASGTTKSTEEPCVPGLCKAQKTPAYSGAGPLGYFRIGWRKASSDSSLERRRNSRGPTQTGNQTLDDCEPIAPMLSECREVLHHTGAPGRACEVRAYPILKCLENSESTSPGPLRITISNSTTHNVTLYRDMSSIQFLDLSNGRLQTIQLHALHDFASLKYLDLPYNVIKSFNGSYNGLTNLKELDLSNNLLGGSGYRQTGFPFWGDRGSEDVVLSFTGLSNLTHLFLSRNGISRLNGNTFDGLASLLYLDLDDNSISSLTPRNFRDLKSLQFLYLRSNSLTSIQRAFTGLESLKVLDLSSNQIHLGEQGPFTGLRNLESLNLATNRITTISPPVFSDLSSLVFLDVSNNYYIFQIKSGAFAALGEVEYLLIGISQLRVVPANIFYGLHSLKFLSTQDHRLCCLLEHAVNTTCIKRSSNHLLESCSSLLPNRPLKIVAWMFALLAVVGNVLVILVRLVDKKLRVAVVTNRFSINQAMADLFMGVYMVLITSADVEHGKDHYLMADQWRQSGQCAFARLLGLVANMASASTLVLSAFGRLLFSTKPSRQVTFFGSWLPIAFCWVLTFVISGLVTVISENAPAKYGFAEMCVPLYFYTQPMDVGFMDITKDSYDGAVLEVSYGVRTAEILQPPIYFSVYYLIVVNLLSSLITVVISVWMVVRKWRLINSLDEITEIPLSSLNDAMADKDPDDNPDSISIPTPHAKTESARDTSDTTTNIPLHCKPSASLEAALDTTPITTFSTNTNNDKADTTEGSPRYTPGPICVTAANIMPDSKSGDTLSGTPDTQTDSTVGTTYYTNTKCDTESETTSDTNTIHDNETADPIYDTISESGNIPMITITPDTAPDSTPQSTTDTTPHTAPDIPLFTTPLDRQLVIQAALRTAVIFGVDILSWLPLLVVAFASLTDALLTSGFSWALLFLITVKAAVNPVFFTFLFYWDDRRCDGNALVYALRMLEDPNDAEEISEEISETRAALDETLARTFGVF